MMLDDGLNWLKNWLTDWLIEWLTNLLMIEDYKWVTGDNQLILTDWLTDYNWLMTDWCMLRTDDWLLMMAE